MWKVILAGGSFAGHARVVPDPDALRERCYCKHEISARFPPGNRAFSFPRTPSRPTRPAPPAGHEIRRLRFPSLNGQPSAGSDASLGLQRTVACQPAQVQVHSTAHPPHPHSRRVRFQADVRTRYAGRQSPGSGRYGARPAEGSWLPGRLFRPVSDWEPCHRTRAPSADLEWPARSNVSALRVLSRC
jgi:hypothetical protein